MGYKLKEYLTEEGKNPFRKWLADLPTVTKAKVQTRLFRAELGNLGDYKRIGHGVNELRLQFGAGYRVYFGFDGDDIVLLLIGGDKGSQKRDIVKAIEYWSDYMRRKESGTKKR